MKVSLVCNIFRTEDAETHNTTNARVEDLVYVNAQGVWSQKSTHAESEH